MQASGKSRYLPSDKSYSFLIRRVCEYVNYENYDRALDNTCCGIAQWYDNEQVGLLIFTSTEFINVTGFYDARKPIFSIKMTR